MKKIRFPDRGPSLKLEWLRTFLAVVDSGGFTRAAKAIRLSQPAVSTQVKELEKCLGTPLFDQASGRPRLTEAGKAAAREARRLLDLAHDLPAAVSDAGGSVRGTLQLGASTTPGNYILPDLMAEFERRHPGARATLAIGNSARILDLLHANEIDLGFVGIKPDRGEFFSRPRFEDEIVPFVSSTHRLAKAKKVSIEDLLSERLVLREATSATRRVFDRWMGQRDAPLNVMELGCPETVKRAVASGLGVGLLSRFSIEWERKEGWLTELKVPQFPIRRPLFMVHHRKKHLTRSIRAFIELLDR